MSSRARRAAQERLRRELFGAGLERPGPEQPTRCDALLRRAKELRGLAERGMKPRAYRREAERLEREAAGVC